MKIEISTEGKNERLTRESIEERSWYRLFNTVLIGISILMFLFLLGISHSSAQESSKTWNENSYTTEEKYLQAIDKAKLNGFYEFQLEDGVRKEIGDPNWTPYTYVHYTNWGVFIFYGLLSLIPVAGFYKIVKEVFLYVVVGKN